ncbi:MULTISPECIES: hypothetical protein [unclassified Moraxella]|uniref:hypothetical protein n=1 Tax=unclassified Moraxella TaxID=2685852 RepID=UPI003AF75E05
MNTLNLTNGALVVGAIHQIPENFQGYYPNATTPVKSDKKMTPVRISVKKHK